MKLNQNEQTVFLAIAANVADVTGGDFGIIEEVYDGYLANSGLSKKQFVGYCSTLRKKNLFGTFYHKVNGGEEIGQTEIFEDGVEVLKELAESGDETATAIISCFV